MAGQADRYQIFIVSGPFPEAALGGQRSDLEGGEIIANSSLSKPGQVPSLTQISRMQAEWHSF
jgi:hypothetical protein